MKYATVGDVVILFLLFCEISGVRHLRYKDRTIRIGPAEKTCPQLKISHGSVRLRGIIARFQCTYPYKLTGSRYALCSRGSWTPGSPVCAKVGCEPLQSLENGYIDYDKSGAVANFFCNPNYEISGNQMQYCDGRNWNGTAPTCIDVNGEPALKCDFENDECGWRQEDYYGVDWLRYDKTGYNAGGFDKTITDAGSFMYFASIDRENYSARLVSPIFPRHVAENGCFSFFYFVNGRNCNTLKVYVRPETQSREVVKFMNSVCTDYQWKRSVFPLDNISENFQILIEGRGGARTAIDNLEILNKDECQDAIRNANIPETPNIRPDSCRNRCNNDDPMTPLGVVMECACTEQCTWATCCSDYESLCLFNDQSSTMETTPLDEIEPQPQTAKLIAFTTHDALPTITSNENYTVKITATPMKKVKSTTPITKTTTLKEKSTTAATQPKEKILKFTLSFKSTTPKPINATGFVSNGEIKFNNKRFISKNSTIKPSTKENVTNKSTVTMPTTIKSTIKSSYNGHILSSYSKDKYIYKAPAKPKGVNFYSISLIVIGIAFVIVAISIAFKRYRIYTRYMQWSTSFPDRNEVQYLTEEEQININS